eukprot:31559-Pelagococcus_subviridis.AAC.6
MLIDRDVDCVLFRVCTPARDRRTLERPLKRQVPAEIPGAFRCSAVDRRHETSPVDVYEFVKALDTGVHGNLFPWVTCHLNRRRRASSAIAEFVRIYHAPAYRDNGSVCDAIARFSRLVPVS